MRRRVGSGGFVSDVGRQDAVDGDILGVGRFHHPIDGHVHVQGEVDVEHGRQVVDQAFPDPGPHVQPLFEAHLLGGIDPGPDLARLAGPIADGFGDLGHPFGQHRGHGRNILRSQEQRHAARGRREVQLHSLGAVFGGQLLQHRVLMVANELVGQAPATLGDLVLAFKPPVGGHAHAGEEVHPLFHGRGRSARSAGPGPGRSGSACSARCASRR